MTKPFILVNNENISLSQAFNYLQQAGKLDGVIGEILRQYVLDREIKTRTDLDVSPETVQQAITEFRIQSGLMEGGQYQQWLESQNLDDFSFHQRVEADLKLGQLREKITQPRLQEFFIERKLYLDQVVLSRITVNSREQAEELYQQIVEGASFEQLAQEFSVSDDRVFNGMMGVMSRGDIPDALRAAVDVSQPGDLIGPVENPPYWCVFRLEQVIPASLENPQLVQVLQNQLLEQWVLEQLQGQSIEIKMDEDV